MNWVYKQKQIKSIEQMNQVSGFPVVGFIYKIYLQDGFSYIGKKSIYFKRRIKPSKKSGKKRCKIKTGEASWADYEGSSYRLQNDLETCRIKIIKKQILYFAQSKTDLNYLEVKEQWLQGVLEDPKSYCDSINGKWFSRVIKEKRI